MKHLVVYLCFLFLSRAVQCSENATEMNDTTTMTSESTLGVKIESTTVRIPYIPTTPPGNDICGLFLDTDDGQTGIKHRRCKCSEIDKEVDCSFLDATHLPTMISFPKSGHFVRFAGNKIENIANDSFYSGKFVFDLDLSHNRIDFVSIVAFRPFQNLRSLDLSYNKIWNLPPKSFEGLSDLGVLNVGYNKLFSLSTDLFMHTTNLKHLNLESNPLLELEPKQFEHLKNLEFLNLESTAMKVIPDHLFTFTPNLKKLKLSHNLLSEVPTTALSFLDSLKYLDLSGNPITCLNGGAFRGMRRLVTLYLERMPMLSVIDKYAFGDVQMLNDLHCSHNYMLTDIDEKAFIKNTTNEKVQLSHLFLKQNSLSSVPKELLDWNNELELHITDNPIYCDCNIEWMVHLRLKNNFQEHTKCYGPANFQDLSLSDLKDSELSCGLEATEIVMIILAGGVGLLILALIISFLVWRRSYSGFSRPYFRVSKKKNMDIDYRGDDCM